MIRARSPLLAILALLAIALPVLASSVTPRVVDSADSCGPLSPGTAELVVDASSLPAGSVSKGDFKASVSLEGTIETGSIAFRDATLPVKSAFVAGKTSGNLYEYPEPVREDEGLVAPDGQTITSVSFCYVNDAASGGNGSGGGSGSSSSAGGAGGGSAAAAGSNGADHTAPATDTAPVPTSTAGDRGWQILTTVLLAVVGVATMLAMLAMPRRRRSVVPVRSTRRRDRR
jgi:hypothetical protein